MSKAGWAQAVKNGEPKALSAAIQEGQYEAEKDGVGVIHMLLRGVSEDSGIPVKFIQTDPHKISFTGTAHGLFDAAIGSQRRCFQLHSQGVYCAASSR